MAITVMTMIETDGDKPSPCSFAPATPVLMADGTHKPIGKIKPGDKVEAADPTTGKDTGGRTVQHLWINHDDDLLDLTVRTGPHTHATLHTTFNHPFYDQTAHTWIAAGKLTPGHLLATTAGHAASVLAVTSTRGTADRDNLTVQQLHTYYVMAGSTPILVHNTCGESNTPGVKDPSLGRGNTGRAQPSDLNEQLAMEQAMSNPAAGKQLPIKMTDPRWPAEDGWVKMQQNVNGTVLHYVYNTTTKEVDDFKFK